MNDLKVEMLGTAIKAGQRDTKDMPLEFILSEPVEAQGVRYVTGLVALTMERGVPPETFADLHSALEVTDMTLAQRALVRYVCMDLLDDGVLQIEADRQLRFRPPETQIYIDALLMDD